MKLQDYSKGEINKTNNGNYQYVVDGEVQGEYPSVARLVNANPESSSGPQDPPVEPAQEEAAPKRSRKSSK